MFCYRGVEHEIYLLIAAAGSSSRMGNASAGGMNKVYADLKGAPVLFHSLYKFDRMSFIDAAVAVIAERDEAAFDSMMKKSSDYFGGARGSKPFGMPVYKAAGGAVRSESVLKGLFKILSLVRNPGNAAVVIHDGARPNFSEASFAFLVIYNGLK
ncbi:MAG TPA: 2-C-methyl-D-erythritol 4-phosphate cytidylyltransferase, partial [Candidatus Wallbacteria bacterium]|nr:2-C-methyl-D-erythritol 4-phosphate cytidylyltransferase [Candidatus Wallbacteria bacterium]